MRLYQFVALLASGVQCHVTRPIEGRNVAESSIRSGSCPPFNRGTFSINAYQLYPENGDWDAKLCQVYFGILFNASFGIYHPYQNRLEVIEFPGLTRNPAQHVGGVGWDAHSGLVSVLINAGAAFTTTPPDVSGTNIIKKFDPRTKTFLWSLNITELVTNGAYGGFNDVTADPRGNTYVVGTFPSSIVRVNRAGTEIIPWYHPQTNDTSINGYTGIASRGDTIVVLDSGAGKLYRFDAAAAKGTPVLVPHYPARVIEGGDGIHLPVKFGGKVLLVAEHFKGVTVLRSRSGRWDEAEHLGTIPNPPGLPEGWLIVSTTQIGERLYIINDWFADLWVPGTVAGNKTEFPMIDITAQVDQLLAA
ncbi:hypothetical protein GE09DRAFT_1216757 [Coniochaeta sp. 2T2.1]|nr:hypothetical protein GE09DRAFT_1216757 [Coniochaeta sp. 2T2.1]